MTEALNRLSREERAKPIFAKTNAIVTNDHFVYTNGEHGPDYVNKDAMYPHTKEIWEACEMFAEAFKDKDVQIVVGPAVGGVILEALTAQHLTRMTGREVCGVYAEKQADGSFTFGRGYADFITGKNVLVTEDVLTTGGSAAATIRAVNLLGGKVVGLAALADRREDKTKDVEGVKVDALIKVNLIKYKPDECKLCELGVPINTKLGKGKKFLADKQASSNH